MLTRDLEFIFSLVRNPNFLPDEQSHPIFHSIHGVRTNPLERLFYFLGSMTAGDPLQYCMLKDRSRTFDFLRGLWFRVEGIQITTKKLEVQDSPDAIST